MAANNDYVNTFTSVFETVIEKCEESCQTFFAGTMHYCAELYEQDKGTLQFPRKKQHYSASHCSILLAAGQIVEIQRHANNIRLLFAEIDKTGIEAIKSTAMAGPKGSEWKALYDSNHSQFKCDKLKKLWDGVVVTRLLASQFEGVAGLAEKIGLSEDELQGIDLSLQGLSLRLHPNSPNYYANDITLFDKFFGQFFKREVRNIPSSSNSSNSMASLSSPMNIPSNRDSQLSPISLANSAPAATSFFNYLVRTVSDISLPSAVEDLSDEEDVAISSVVKRSLTPAVRRKG